MCRVLTYLGPPVALEDLLYKPNNSFIKQSYDPRHMSQLLNLAGFGMIAWDNKSYNPEIPYFYKTSQLPFYDENLRRMAEKINPSCFLTHIRGVPYKKNEVVSTQNAHPFLYSNVKVALAHNGTLKELDKMKVDLFNAIDPEYVKLISGTTDSEWIYALFLTYLAKEPPNYTVKNIGNAIINTFKTLIEIRKKNNINLASPVNLFITDGNFLVATRHTLDYGWNTASEQFNPKNIYNSLWYTYGEKYGFFGNEYRMQEGEKQSCIIIASEPLTEDTTTWIELPEYTMLMAWRENNEIQILSEDIIL